MSLEVRGLCKAYGQVVVADRIDIDLPVGKCLGVIGPNGAGKSSLFHLLTGTVAADSGHIALDGKALSGLPANPRVVVSGNFATPHATLAALDSAVAVYRLHALNAQVGLARGEPLIEAGLALGLTAETTRNYSKRIYGKTGASGHTART